MGNQLYSSPGLLVERQPCTPEPYTNTLRNIPLAGVVLLGKSTVSAPGSSGSFLPSKGKQSGIRHLFSPPISAQQLFATCCKNKPRGELKLSYQHVPGGDVKGTGHTAGSTCPAGREQRELEKVPNQTTEKLKPRAHSPLENHSSIGEAERRTGERGGRRREVPTASWGRSFGKKAKGRGNTGEKGRWGVSGHLSITVPPPQKPTISLCQMLWLSQAAAPKAGGGTDHCVSRESCRLAFAQEMPE